MAKKLINWKYTVGEIVIVSVGILIAFAINTYSSNLKSKHDFKEYKNSLVADLNKNIENLDSVILHQNQKISNLNDVIVQIETAELDEDAIAFILIQERKSPTFYPIHGTFKSLVSHGDIELFSTPMKRELFNLYDSWYEKTVYNGNLYDKNYVEIYDRQIREIIDFRTKKIDNIAKLTSKVFIKDLLFIIEESESYLKLAEISKEESYKVLRLINAN